MKSSADGVMGLPPHFTRPVPVADLVPADSPRLGGIDESHAQQLAEVYALLPPILVHRPTMRVIDGMHRLRAATIVGLDVIDAQFFDGAEEEAFIQSVARNIAHGLPLSLADRKAAAGRILAAFPAMPNQSVAVYTGLDAEAVAEVRRRSATGPSQLNAGASGKGRPLDRMSERRQVAERVPPRSEPPSRAAVRESGRPLGTAHGARRLLRRSEESVAADRPGTSSPQASGTRKPPVGAGGTPGPDRRAPKRPVHPAATRSSLDLLRSLAADPSLRDSEAGRDFLRWLHAHFFTDEAWRRRIGAVPPHCTDTVAEVALKCSDIWLRFAQELSDRRNCVPVAPDRAHD